VHQLAPTPTARTPTAALTPPAPTVHQLARTRVSYAAHVLRPLCGVRNACASAGWTQPA